MANELIHEPRLKWVLVNGELHDVSEFSHIPSNSRPVAYCPVCKNQVIMKLGKIKAHHYSHRPEDFCATSKPETLIHLNTKLHLYEQLKSAQRVSINLPCYECGKPRITTWKRNWDSVEVEYTMDSMRPDVVLIEDGQVIGAIEVYVTHEVDEIKASKLLLKGIDWIEISGHVNFYEDPKPWNPLKPLDIVKHYPESDWMCFDCREELAKREYWKNNHTDIVAARLVDIYYYTGKKYRRRYYVKYVVADGDKKAIWIEDEGHLIVAMENAPITVESEQKLSTAFKQILAKLKQNAAVVDDHMPWVRWEAGRYFYPRDFENFPFRYKWRKDARKWKLQKEKRWKEIWK